MRLTASATFGVIGLAIVMAAGCAPPSGDGGGGRGGSGRQGHLSSPWSLATRTTAPIVRPAPLYQLRTSSLDPLRRLTSLARIENGILRVPNVAPARLPAALNAVDVAERKRLFFRSLLPLVLHENSRILEDRERIIGLFSHPDHPIDGADQRWLVAVADWYRVPYGDGTPLDATRDLLLRRVDEIPVPLVLAQAAVESAWGTSRFCRLGNALFGVWTYDPGDIGLIPAARDSGATHRVKSYPTLIESLRDYMRILNSSYAYTEFRSLRLAQRRRGLPLDSFALAGALTRYSERRAHYVQDLHIIMRQNHLDRFQRAELYPAGLAILTSYDVEGFGRVARSSQLDDLAWLARTSRDATVDTLAVAGTP